MHYFTLTLKFVSYVLARIVADEDHKFQHIWPAVGGCHSITGWSGPKSQQNKTDNFLSVTDTLYVIVTSQKGKGKALKEHILNNIVPRGFDARIAEIQEEHHQTVQDHHDQIQTT